MFSALNPYNKFPYENGSPSAISYRYERYRTVGTAKSLGESVSKPVISSRIKFYKEPNFDPSPWLPRDYVDAFQDPALLEKEEVSGSAPRGFVNGRQSLCRRR